MSFVALDSANTLNPVQRLLKLTLDLFYACSTFDSIELKGPTVLIVRINILLSGMRSFIHLLWFLWLHELVAIWPPRRPLHTRPPQARCRPGRWLYPSHLLAVTIWGNRITRDWQVKVCLNSKGKGVTLVYYSDSGLGLKGFKLEFFHFPRNNRNNNAN